MTRCGYVKVHRRIIDRGVADNELGFLVRLICAANWNGAKFKGRKIQRGQLVLSDRGMQSRLYPGDESPPAIATIKRRLDRLAADGTITIDTARGSSGGRLVTITNYAKYQSGNALDSSAKVSANISANVSADIRRSKKKQETSSRKRDGQRSNQRNYSPEFDQWWQHYPRKVGKPSAFRSFGPALARIRSERQLSDEDALAWLIRQTDAYARDVADKASQHTKHPGPWLNDDRFNDVGETHSRPATVPFDDRDAI